MRRCTGLRGMSDPPPHSSFHSLENENLREPTYPPWKKNSGSAHGCLVFALYLKKINISYQIIGKINIASQTCMCRYPTHVQAI